MPLLYTGCKLIACMRHKIVESDRSRYQLLDLGQSFSDHERISSSYVTFSFDCCVCLQCCNRCTCSFNDYSAVKLKK